jgi:hypothetical protein
LLNRSSLSIAESLNYKELAFVQRVKGVYPGFSENLDLDRLNRLLFEPYLTGQVGVFIVSDSTEIEGKIIHINQIVLDYN